MTLADHIIQTVERLKEPLNLDRWFIKLEHGPLEDARAACSAEPEYKSATLAFDLDKLQTGDELDEIITHEMMHPHTWATFQLAENLADLVADSTPEHMREAQRVFLKEQVRVAGEDVNTQVSFVVIKLLRRLAAAQKDASELRRAARRVIRAHEMDNEKEKGAGLEQLQQAARP